MKKKKKVESLGFQVSDLGSGFRVWGLVLRVLGSGFRISVDQGLGFRV